MVGTLVALGKEEKANEIEIESTTTHS